MIFQLGKKNNNTQEADRRDILQRENIQGGINGEPAFLQSGSGFSLSGQQSMPHQGMPHQGTISQGSGFSSNPVSSVAEPGTSAAETVRRWREAAAIARSSAAHMIDGGEYIENSSKIDNGAQLSVEWPDPRAAITLNKPISSMGGELEDAEIHAPISGGQSPIQSQPLIQDTPLRASAPAKPETTKSEVGSLVSRTFPFFRSSSQSSSPALAKGGNVAQNGTSVNSVAVNGAVGVNSAPHGAAHQNGSVVLDAQKGGTAVNAGGIMSGNAMLSGGPLAGNQAAQNGEAGANVLGRNPAWKEQRPGSPGDVISAIKGRTQLPPEEEIKARFGTNIKSALGPGTIIEGKFRFDSPVSIEGTLIGEVTSNSVLIVGSQATVTAKISVGSLIILGRVHGDVECEELLEIKSTGHLEGDVRSKRIAIDDGGWFRGLCTPTSKPEPSEI